MKINETGTELENWLTSGGQQIHLSEIKSKLNSFNEIHIGTDSQPSSQKVLFVTTICFVGSSGIDYFYRKLRVDIKEIPSIYLRLRKEVFLSVNLADALRNFNGKKITVHADVNSLPHGYSHRFNKEFCSYVEAMGFNYRCKPNAWAANTVANWHTK